MRINSIYLFTLYYLSLLPHTCGSGDKEPAYKYRRHKRLRFDPWVRKIPWRRE